MSRFKIPNDERKFSQANDGDVAGNIWLSQNLDTKSNKGKLRVSPRLVVNVADDCVDVILHITLEVEFDILLLITTSLEDETAPVEST